MRNAILTILCSFAASFAGEMYTIVQGGQDNHVTFTSEAPLEEIVGKTNIVTGFVMLPDASHPGSAEIHVDMASFDTGMSLRNKHMRENHLETDKFPEAVFKLTRLEIPGEHLQEGSRTAVNLSGTMLLHGVSREISPIAWLTVNGSDLLIEAKFTLRLQDYNITRPEFLIMKLADEQRIDVKLVASK
ncbi:YceI family protein [bacterium]|nr:YceI family protein [bacterium]